MFVDLFTDVGRSVPPMIVAVVMVLARIEGCSDREAVDRVRGEAVMDQVVIGMDPHKASATIEEGIVEHLSARTGTATSS